MTKTRAAITTGGIIAVICAYAAWSINSPDPLLRLESELDQASRAAVFNYIEENPPLSRGLSPSEVWWRLRNPYAAKIEPFSAAKVEFFDEPAAISISYPDGRQDVFIEVAVDGSWRVVTRSLDGLKIGSLFGAYEQAEQAGYGDGE